MENQYEKNSDIYFWFNITAVKNKIIIIVIIFLIYSTYPSVLITSRGNVFYLS